MNQDPPVLIPYAEKDIYSDINTNSIEPTFNQEPACNGYLTNGNKSPPMPILYEADNEPPMLFNIQDIFSALSKDEFNQTDFSKTERRNESDSLFEKIYKDYKSTLTNSPNSTTLNKNITNSQVHVSSDKLETNCKESQIIAEVKEVDVENNDSNKSISKEVTKKTRKRKAKRVEPKVIDDEDLKKHGVKSISKRRKEVQSTNLEEPPSIQTKELNDNKYLRSPFITLRHRTPKKFATTTNVISSSYEIVNPVLKSSSDHHSSVYRPNTKAFLNNQFSTTTNCVCALCGMPSSFLELGSLYGPYFIDRDSVHTLPLTSIFPSEANEIGVSGKSAIKSDKNGNVKMVIQSSKGARSSTSKKTAADDYRVTWDGELWLHMECVLWAPGTYLRGDGKIGCIDEALKMALNAECCVCHKIGAILNCTAKGCDKNFHYHCASTKDCKMNSEQLSVLCCKHKDR